MSFIGVVVLIALAVLLSSNRRAIKLQTVAGAFALQAGLGAFALYVPWGQATLTAISDSVALLQDYGNEGISFVFGPLAGSQMSEVFGSQGFVFAIKVLPLIVFFSSFIAILYYLGIMNVVIRVIGGGLQRVLGTSRTESMSATANIFVSQSEAPIVVRPFLEGMTRSELFAVMVGGMASVAGSVLIGYASLGVELKYLIAASFMAAPGGLLMAKLMEPQTAEPRDSFSDIQVYPDDKPANVIDAAALGVSNGLQLILGHVFAPLAFVLGVPWSEAMVAGSFIGEKLVLNEFVAYVDFAAYLDPVQAAAKGIQVLSGPTQVIVTFALCGFANLSSIGILLGSLGVMAPSRRQDIARLGLRAVIAGTLSNLMSAALAGVFISL